MPIFSLSRCAAVLLCVALCVACTSENTPADGGSGQPVGCPSTPPASSGGTACVETGLTCVYSGYAYTCADCNPELAGEGLTWCVSQLSPGCPSLVPGLGTACGSPGLICSYNPCVTGGIAVVCDGGVWMNENVVCPL